MIRRFLPLAALAALLVGNVSAGSAPDPVTPGQAAVVTSLDSSTSTLDLSNAPTLDPPAAIIEEPIVAPSAPPVPVAVVPVVPVIPVAPPQPSVCPANYFCYPRVGIAGPIVPYSDCSGTTDVGAAIRNLTCVSSTYLAAHAYTQFGRIAGWRAGDIVFALGTRYVLVDAFTQPGCVLAARAYAPLSLQTSLTATHCGPVLVVQGRPG